MKLLLKTNNEADTLTHMKLTVSNDTKLIIKS